MGQEKSGNLSRTQSASPPSPNGILRFNVHSTKCPYSLVHNHKTSSIFSWTRLYGQWTKRFKMDTNYSCKYNMSLRVCYFSYILMWHIESFIQGGGELSVLCYKEDLLVWYWRNFLQERGYYPPLKGFRGRDIISYPIIILIECLPQFIFYYIYIMF